MLEKLDMESKTSKEEYNELMETIGVQLGEVQRKAREGKKPVVIIFEGWRGARRSNIINNMMQEMDARGFNVYSSVRISEDMKEQPFFAPFWHQLPAKGNISVYHRSWYYLKFADEGKSVASISYKHINNFERMLTDDGYLILKYFLHLTPEQQRKNLEKKSKTLGKAWRELNPAFDESGDYDTYLEQYEKMLEMTDTVNAPWHLLAANDSRTAQLALFRSIIRAVTSALEAEPAVYPEQARPMNGYDVLSKIPLDKEMSKDEYKEKLDKYQKRLGQLQVEMFQAGISTVIAFEGWDAAGKGGAIRRLTSGLDPLGFNVQPVAAPNVVERAFHYLWRFWMRLPAKGNIAIFDRTWYGRVMVERLEGFAKPHEWQRAYDEIKDMEAQWAEHGIAIAKFWLQIDQDEQLRRFNDRQADPLKQWKITDEDWRNREKWSAYEAAVNEMLVRTDTSYAPWTIVEGNNKYYARLKVMKTVIDLFEKKLAEHKAEHKD